MKTNLLFSERQIGERVAELGKQISERYKGEQILCVGVLKGAFMFFGELVRRIEGDVTIDFIKLHSYDGASTTGNISLEYDITESAEGKNVLIIEDIVDSGYTIRFLKNHFLSKNAASVSVACLIDRPVGRKVDEAPDYAAFRITSPHFLVGYGLDYEQKFRNLGDIMEVEFE